MLCYCTSYVLQGLWHASYYYHLHYDCLEIIPDGKGLSLTLLSTCSISKNVRRVVAEKKNGGTNEYK